MADNKLGWIFKESGSDGIPYFQCPYCSRIVDGKTYLFGIFDFSKCPNCHKALHLDNLTEDDELAIRSYYWGE